MAGDYCYLLMELVDGVSLWQMENAKKRLAPEEALAIVPKVCEALQYAHNQGIVHRDIKPANILIDKEGRVKIADFGLAKLAGTAGTLGLTQSRAAMGTPHYMAPEQIEKPLQVDHRADIFSLGVVFYEMLTGELPLGRFAPPSARAQTDVRLDDVVMHTLEKEPNQRYQQASQIKTDVENISGNPGAVPPDIAATAPSAPADPAATASTPQISVAIKQRVQAAGSALIALGVLNFFLSAFAFAAFSNVVEHSNKFSNGLVAVSAMMFVFTGPFFSILLFIAGVKMKRFRSYHFAFCAGIVAMVAPPSCAMIFGIGIGLWVLLTLRLPEVRAAFEANIGLPPRVIKRRTKVIAAIAVGCVALFVFAMIDSANNNARNRERERRNVNSINTFELHLDCMPMSTVFKSADAPFYAIKFGAQANELGPRHPLPDEWDARLAAMEALYRNSDLDDVDVIVNVAAHSLTFVDCSIIPISYEKYHTILNSPISAGIFDNNTSLKTIEMGQQGYTTYLVKTRNQRLGVIQVNRNNGPQQSINYTLGENKPLPAPDRPINAKPLIPDAPHVNPPVAPELVLPEAPTQGN